MRVFTFSHGSLAESQTVPDRLPEAGFIWVACARREFEVHQAALQGMLHSLCGTSLVEVHMTDLLSNQLPSHYDYTSEYDVLVFRRLAAGSSETDLSEPGAPLHVASSRGGPPVLRRIDTSPVGFAVFDHILLTVHPTDCAVRDAFAVRLAANASAASRAAGVRLPSSPADLMLRIVNHMVDGYLELRRELTRQLDHWQLELLNPNTRFNNWSALLDARTSLHQLDEICEDQRAAVQDWIDALATWPEAQTPVAQRDRELLMVRSRDVLEHIERVVHHVRRLENSAEAAVQMHFSVQTNRANDIMRTLTVLTAIFLPLNLITGFFGMNFESLPLIHMGYGVAVASFFMLCVAVTLLYVFWRRGYFGRARR